MAEQQPIAPVTPEEEPLTRANALDMRDPMKWQMKIRLHLEHLSPQDASIWLEGVRFIMTMSAGVVRDVVNRGTVERCFVCNKVFKRTVDGRNMIAGEGGYYDADRNYVHVYVCEAFEMTDMYKRIKQKEDDNEANEEKARKAARQAVIDSRRASNLRESRG